MVFAMWFIIFSASHVDSILFGINIRQYILKKEIFIICPEGAFNFRFVISNSLLLFAYVVSKAVNFVFGEECFAPLLRSAEVVTSGACRLQWSRKIVWRSACEKSDFRNFVEQLKLVNDSAMKFNDVFSLASIALIRGAAMAKYTARIMPCLKNMITAMVFLRSIGQHGNGSFQSFIADFSKDTHTHVYFRNP